MAPGDRAEVRAGEHERAEGCWGIYWVRVCRELEKLVEEFDWVALDHRGWGVLCR